MVSIEDLIKEREQLKNRIKRLENYYIAKKTEFSDVIEKNIPLEDNSEIINLKKELSLLKEKIDEKQEESKNITSDLTENENQKVIMKELEALKSQIKDKEDELSIFDDKLLNNVSKMTEIERQLKN